MNNLFILGYSEANYFNEWFGKLTLPRTKMYFIDNGKQIIPSELEQSVLYRTSKNVGCAGGWNLCCDIAFNYMNLDYVIIGEEDATFFPNILDEIEANTNPTQLCGTYAKSFEFALFGIHRAMWEKVGRFDENFLFAGCEDNDYKHRCKLNGVSVMGLNYPAEMNGHSTTHAHSGLIPSETRRSNGKYIVDKWGPNYEYNSPFNDSTYQGHLSDMMKKYYGNDITEEPSKTEFKKFLQSKI